MKKLYINFIKYFLTFSFLLVFTNIKAEYAVDNDGMPRIYLRGSMTEWKVQDKYEFKREGTLYTLTIDASNALPDGEFKIADSNWEAVDFGGESKGIYVDEEATKLVLVRAGQNLCTRGMSNVTISFKYTTDNEMEVYFNIPPSEDYSGTLPVLHINVYTDKTHKNLNNEIISYTLGHKEYFNDAEYWLDVNGCKWLEDLGAKSIGSAEEPLPLQIKARGNWTRIGFSKKPFKLKLDKKQNMLGLTPEKSKHYALLAHADDTDGYLRNFTAFNLGERIGLPWTPGMQPVEVVINGDYRGLYFLTESIRIGDGRIMIEELGDNVTDSDLVSGGYLVELDNYDEENQIRMDEKGCVGNQFYDRLRITWDTPEIYSELQKRFITDQFSAMNDFIGSNSDDTWSYLDLDDAARYYLVNEIVSHVEAFHGSTYLFRDRGEGEKWHFSPLWDAGNAFRGYTDTFIYNCDPFGNTWIPSMRENKMFNDKVKETWLWFMQNEYSGVEEDMDEFIDHLRGAAQYDYKRWHAEPCPDGGQRVADNRDLDYKLREVKSHLEAKISWLKSQFGDYTAGIFEEPARDDTPAAPLPEYAQAGIQEIYDFDFGKDVEYFNLQGMKVQNPKKGEIYIMRQGSKARKVMMR